ncbi:Glycosyl hydrolase family 32 domain protein [Coriobacterium glomerans PW2]|uniref:beta-fructofuranosidase n=1 Tax=Coriobacterium glomerans (strain ATCC 49209 / DSM 20642 / JCM 10262 / PW2) TaxID=700015 RepID=F2NA76_CORGP|nr:glycoside hydrolase family 32 protein [Coriobacterium glomerans]AEB06470.1 Glycosyl hydrolase family 32 domain protein [Coriobacterium glomerans PW2]
MSNPLQRELTRLVRRTELDFERRGHGRFGQRFHLMPPVGWLNDPNGLCQKDGIFHAYFQYAPFDARGGLKFWGHSTSRDLLTWDYDRAVLLPDEPFDCHGVYSGSAIVSDDRISVLYTGNVKRDSSDASFDYVSAGRDAATVLVESADGTHFGSKRVVLSGEDYPGDLTCHVRDPKIWRENDRFLMVLGARRRTGCSVREDSGRHDARSKERSDRGEVLVYESRDLRIWTLINRITSAERLGYMWECPDCFTLPCESPRPDRPVRVPDEIPSATSPSAARGASITLLSFCPQGLAGEPWDRRNRYQSGYARLRGGIAGTCEVADFELWDAGFDFYAAQTFQTRDDRRILIGWMGMADVDSYGNDPTVADGWQHCFSLPREIHATSSGRVLQRPVRELDALHGRSSTATGSMRTGVSAAFDVEISRISKQFSALLHGELQLSWKQAEAGLPTRFEMRFVDPARSSAGCGRKLRWEPLENLASVRIVADTSSVEVFVNDGELVMSTRCYPRERSLSVSSADSIIRYREIG